MRELVRWWVRQPRLWVCLAAVATAAATTAADGRPAWTTLAVALSAGLSALALRWYFVDAHPDWREERQARREERFAAEVARLVDRYDAASRPAGRRRR